VKLKMVIGEKLWEGKGKSGASFIKSIDMSGVTSMYTWTAQMKGMGTGVSMTPPKGLATSTDQGMIMTMTGDMGTIKGYDLMKMVPGKNPTSVGLWSFMTMAEKLGWLNETIALVTFEAADPMWMEMNITIWEWK
jgi:hypothetical protein